LGAK
jgi:hypothetical protein